MKILFYLARYPAYGGIERVTTVLANYFTTVYNWKISILSSEQEDESNLLNLLDSSVGFYRLPFPEKIIDSRNKSYFDCLLKELSVNTIIFQDSYALVESLLYRIPQNIKLITVEHNTPDCYLKTYNYGWKNVQSKTLFEFLKKILYPYFYIRIFKEIRQRHRKLYQLSDRYILLSENFIPVFQQISGLKHINKLNVIGNPLTIPILKNEYTTKEKICLFVGRLTEQKGIDLLMNIWEKVEESGSDWKLVIVGDGNKCEFMKQYILKSRLRQIQWVGNQSNVTPYYQKAKILCMTSIFEGWGLVLVEAMAHGCIPVAFDSFLSISTIINAGRDGYLIPPFEKNKYRDKLLSLMNNPILCNKIAGNALQKSKSFCMNEIAIQWKDIII